MKKIRTRILIETSQVSLVRKADGLPVVQCDECATLMVTLDEASALCATGMLFIFRLIEAGAIHFTETPKGELLVCLNSLNRAKQTSLCSSD